jgi:hypothetical protein
MRSAGSSKLAMWDLDRNLEATFFIVLPVILIGFVLYLRTQRYIRRRTAWSTVAVLTLFIVAYAVWINGASP